jgi:hypothetical protein
MDAYTPMARFRGGPSEGDGDQRQGGGRGHRAADALLDAGGEQPRLVGGEPAEQRRPGQDQDAGDEDPAAPQ